jgi:hypothetical protein
MSYGNIKRKTQEAAEPVSTLRCYANNCPCIGSISVDGGRWCCPAHAFAISDEWPRITSKLREHDWLAAFISDVQRMDRLNEDWRGFASQFWASQDPPCVPHAQENAIPYANRMRGELMWRCGLSKRPQVRLPQPVKVRGNAAGKVFAERMAA